MAISALKKGFLVCVSTRAVSKSQAYNRLTILLVVRSKDHGDDMNFSLRKNANRREEYN